MAIGTSLVRLLDDFRAEAGLSLNPAHNASVRDTQVKRLQRVQDWLWDEFDWPYMLAERDVPVQQGQRYYSPPDDLPLMKLREIRVWVNMGWLTLMPEISPGLYTAHNSDLGYQSWPPQAWRIWDGRDVEIWPIANQNADMTTRNGVLRFVGIRKLNPLVADDDRAELDDRLIVLYAAAEELAARGSKDAKLKLDQANSLFARFRSDFMPSRRFSMFGVTNKPVVHRPYIGYYRRPVN